MSADVHQTMKTPASSLTGVVLHDGSNTHVIHIMVVQQQHLKDWVLITF